MVSLITIAYAVAISIVMPVVHSEMIFTKIAVFGDSHSDIGNGAFRLTHNTSLIIPNNSTYSNGRFSNGDIYSQYLAKRFEVPLVSYAVAGALTSDRDLGHRPGCVSDVITESLQSNSSLIYAPGVDTQIMGYYKNQQMRHREDEIEGTLFILWSGQSDEIASRKFNPEPKPHHLGRAHYRNWASLATMGARHILAVVPPITSKFSLIQASKMEAEAIKFKLQYPDVNFHLFRKMTHVYAAIKAKRYGFVNTKDACCVHCFRGLPDATVCTHPQNYLYWDSIHFTTRVHRMIAARMGDYILNHYDYMDYLGMEKNKI